MLSFPLKSDVPQNVQRLKKGAGAIYHNCIFHNTDTYISRKLDVFELTGLVN